MLFSALYVYAHKKTLPRLHTVTPPIIPYNYLYSSEAGSSPLATQKLCGKHLPIWGHDAPSQSAINTVPVLCFLDTKRRSLLEEKLRRRSDMVVVESSVFSCYISFRLFSYTDYEVLSRSDKNIPTNFIQILQRLE